MSFAENAKAVVERLSQIRIVPVLVLEEETSGLKMCEVLLECGLPAAEITFRTSAAAGIIKEAAARFPELYLGAGTILNTADLHRAFDAGAKFAVAPGFNPTVVKEAVANDYAFAPGVCTPSEIEQAMEVAMNHFRKEFDGCTMTKIEYDEEKSGKAAREWAQQYGADEGIVLYSSFDVDASGGDGSFNPNSTYTKWQWILTRNKGEGWVLRTWGYG